MNLASLRRLLLIGGLCVMTAACTIPVPPPPPEDDRQLKLTDSFSPAEGQGIVTGFAGHVVRRRPSRSSEEVETPRRQLVLVNERNELWYLPMVSRPTEAKPVVDGLTVSVEEPFAFQLPAGLYQIAGMRRYELFSFSSMPVGPTIVTNRYYSWIPTRLPPNTFEVKAGEVAYLGRIGVHQGFARFPDKETRDSVCHEQNRLDRYESGYYVWDCAFMTPVAEAYPEGLAALVRRYPALAGRDLPSRPLPQARGWRQWSDSVRAPIVANTPPR